MPKYVKPSCILSKTCKNRRIKENSINVKIPLEFQLKNTFLIQDLPVNKVATLNERPSTDCSYELNNNAIQYSSRVPKDLIEFEQNEFHQELNINYKQNIDIPVTFKSQLASFVISSRLSRNKTTDLLKLLKSVDSIECLQNLPLDSRTLLSTPISGKVNIISLAGGEYIHFGISKGLAHLYQVDNQVQQLSVFELWFNIDGLPVDKRGSSFWPILCGVCTNMSVKPFIVGAYFGLKKPQDIHAYLNPFITELRDLLQNGITIANSFISIRLKGIIADAPARAFIKQIKNHSGYYGCEKCVEEGDYISVKYKMKTIGNICFPNSKAELRTDETFVQRLNEEHHTGISPLLDIPGLGIVSCIPLDYMHLCCLGIMKKIIKLIVRGTRNGSRHSIRLSKDQIICVNNRMKKVAKWLCTDFVRIPTDLNNFNSYKATELRQILIYTGPYILKNIVTTPIYNNFIVLNIAMRILACSKTVYAQNSFASSLTKHFLKTFCIIYGQMNASYNIHSVIHLADDAKKMANCSKQLYAVVALDNGKTITIPIFWLICGDDSKDIEKNKDYKLYLPLYHTESEAQKYASIKKEWTLSFGKVLNLTDSYVRGNYEATLENIKKYKFAIIEFLDEESAEVVSCNWIIADDSEQLYKCQWPGSKNALKYTQSEKNPKTSWQIYDCVPRKFFQLYTDAKNQLANFCNTSSTEVDDVKVNQNRKPKKKRHFDESSEYEKTVLVKKNLISKTTKPIKVNKQQFVNPSSDESDNNSESMFSNLSMQNVPVPSGVFDICDPGNIMPTNLQESKICPVTTAEFSEIENSGLQMCTVADVMNVVQHIGHSMMKVSSQMILLQKDLSIIKVDVIKNQEMLLDLTEKSRRQTAHLTEVSFDRSRLKLPLTTIEELNALEANDELKEILAHIINRNGKTFDAKRTIYQVMKILMSNCVAENLNMQGRRGDKLAFGDLGLCTLITESVKDMFPEESINTIKHFIGEWLKQAKRRL